MTATVAALVIEDGKLSWKSTLGEILSATFPRMDPAWSTVTLAQLLEHRSGVPNDGAYIWKRSRRCGGNFWKRCEHTKMSFVTTLLSILWRPHQQRELREEEAVANLVPPPALLPTHSTLSRLPRAVGPHQRRLCPSGFQDEGGLPPELLIFIIAK
jgi:CubicO group peptidase (beta-lactamase class C family)